MANRNLPFFFYPEVSQHLVLGSTSICRKFPPQITSTWSEIVSLTRSRFSWNDARLLHIFYIRLIRTVSKKIYGKITPMYFLPNNIASDLNFEFQRDVSSIYLCMHTYIQIYTYYIHVKIWFMLHAEQTIVYIREISSYIFNEFINVHVNSWTLIKMHKHRQLFSMYMSIYLSLQTIFVLVFCFVKQKNYNVNFLSFFFQESCFIFLKIYA